MKYGAVCSVHTEVVIEAFGYTRFAAFGTNPVKAGSTGDIPAWMDGRTH